MEKDIQRAILDYLKIIKIFAWRNNSGGFVDKNNHYYRFGLLGSADILGILPDGRFLAIEVKGKKGKPTPHQEEFLRIIKKNNGVAFIARSVDDVIQQLGNYAKRR